jgi:hypothetical protein
MPTMKRVFSLFLSLPLLVGCAASELGFDAEAFRRNEEPGWCSLPIPFPFSLNCGEPRAGMWTEVRAVLQPGMARSEVLELLGPPDGQDEDTLRYGMGSSPFGIDPDYLTIHFDDDDRLMRVALTRG